jgi:hypothetical protein
VAAAAALTARVRSPQPPSPVVTRPPAARLTGPRVCILCGGPLRGGQPMLRVHGTTIHARCSHATA